MTAYRERMKAGDYNPPKTSTPQTKTAPKRATTKRTTKRKPRS